MTEKEKRYCADCFYCVEHIFYTSTAEFCMLKSKYLHDLPFCVDCFRELPK